MTNVIASQNGHSAAKAGKAKFSTQEVMDMEHEYSA